MKNKYLVKGIKWVFAYVIAAFILIYFGSCYNTKKAERQTNKALIIYPAVVAAIARTAFPCYVVKSENKIDSADYKKWKDSVNILNDIYDDIFNQIQPVLIHDTTNNCLLFKDNEIKFRLQIDNQKKLIAGLNYKIDNIKPIIDSSKSWFKDSADMEVYISIIDDKDKEIAERDKTIIKLQANSNTDSDTIKRKNKWILYLWLAVAVSAIGIILKLIIKLK